LIVWLWDAPGESSSARGVSDNQATAQEDAESLLISGQATSAVVQAARLIDDPHATEARYARFGSRWEGTRTRNGNLHWREQATQPSA